MPYVKKERRDALLAGEPPKNVGELNFVMTIEIIHRWESLPCYETIHKLSREFLDAECQFVADCVRLYRQFAPADIYAAAMLAYLEFYRRVGSKYEDLKAQENGDVYRHVSLKRKTA